MIYTYNRPTVQHTHTHTLTYKLSDDHTYTFTHALSHSLSHTPTFQLILLSILPDLKIRQREKVNKREGTKKPSTSRNQWHARHMHTLTPETPCARASHQSYHPSATFSPAIPPQHSYTQPQPTIETPSSHNLTPHSNAHTCCAAGVKLLEKKKKNSTTLAVQSSHRGSGVLTYHRPQRSVVQSVRIEKETQTDRQRETDRQTDSKTD